MDLTLQKSLLVSDYLGGKEEKEEKKGLAPDMSRPQYNIIHSNTVGAM